MVSVSEWLFSDTGELAFKFGGLGVYFYWERRLYHIFKRLNYSCSEDTLGVLWGIPIECMYGEKIRNYFSGI